MNTGETFTFRLRVAATNQILNHPTNLSQVEWTGCYGNPLCPTNTDVIILNFSSADAVCIQTINLNAGCNLVSLDVSPVSNNLLDILFQPFNLKDGFGCWINIENADVLTTEGICIANDFRKPLDAGWYLIAYPPDAPQAPEIYYADLIADGNLEFVTGYYNRTVTFDPNVPSFFNTLKEMKNGFG